MNHFHYVGNLFKRLLIENNFITQQPVNWTLYKPQNQKECDETIMELKSRLLPWNMFSRCKNYNEPEQTTNT